jgi:NDP-sugar pyrophosphorylase family protein
MTMIVREDPRASALGAIEVDAEGRVRRILDEGDAPAVPVRRCLFTGIYVLSPDIGPELPDEGCVVRHTLRRLLASGEPVGALVDKGPWHDLGTIGSYAEVTMGLLDGTIAFPGVAPPFEARWVDPLARVGEGVRLGQHIAVGARAVLSGHGTIERAIVWDGAHVTAPLAGEVVTGAGRRVPFGAGVAGRTSGT